MQAIGTNQNAETIPLYGADGISALIDGSTGFQIESTDVAESNLSNALTYSIKHPLTYIISANQSPYDWYTSNISNQNNFLWCERFQGKGVYDPCPEGWQVSSNGTWNDFTTESTLYYIEGAQTSTGNTTVTNGILYKGIVWYPTPGRREFINGHLSYTGNSIFSWSSTCSGVSARNFYGYMGGITLSISFGRSNGFSVRCVQE
ncbi:MAG TPA: fibrobacter succinogenes major paralogous domain-containing protein [Candidatus Rikenella faecigallinarum]|uniref:Fibrobacter succinogenes major paralogous domain-containing protein n=1 Tax=Candidatus Rikenella faecigallinarum TaxID=2838745 RepID=A0A9D1QE26_9BACT|nr:fibrobacter succinogenes major paralogous domain-containing protein [Candidatus Rikenella faecigallinarum]